MNDVRIDLGAYNSLLGRAYTEIAADSRSMHKSQGFGAAERRGSVVNYFKLIAGDPAKDGHMDFAGMNEGFKQFFGTPDQPNKPTRATVQVAAAIGIG